MMDSDDTHSLAAERLFFNLLGRGESIDDEAFAALLRDRPDLATDLEQVRRDYDANRAVLLNRKIAATAVRGGDQLATLLRGRRAFGDRYRLVHTLARGGMGVVREAWDRDLDRSIALKAAHGGGSSSSIDLRQRLIAEEAQVLGKLDHPAILPVHEIGLDSDDRLYFTMPLVAGTTLTDCIADRDLEGGWPLPRRIRVLAAVCSAVEYAHSRGVVHRDIKPDNIMVGEHGEARLVDWGLCSLLGEPTEDQQPLTLEVAADGSLVTGDGRVIGTPAYMAPEQAAGRAADERSDVYALGATLYHTLSRSAPYSDDARSTDMEALVTLVRSQPPTRLGAMDEHAPAPLVAICERAMARDPAQRYESVTEFRAELEAWLDGRVVRSFESGAWAELRRWTQRNPVIAALGVGLVIAIAGFGAALHRWLTTERDRREAADARFILEATLGTDSFLTQLERDAEALGPVRSTMVGAMEQLLTRAHALDERQTNANAVAARLRDAPPQYIEGGTVERLLEITTPLDARFQAAHTRTLPDLRARLADARAIEELSITRHAERWREARGAILRSERYGAGRVDLEPQVGLVPLGENPATRLWEFYHLLSAENREQLPVIEADGSIRVEADMGIVFVLVPGGLAHVGCQSEDPERPYYSKAGAASGMTPVQSVELAPFFVARHELTRGQWLRLSNGDEPSYYTPQNHYTLSNNRHPVENFSFESCDRLLARYELTAPTAAQWEYAARAGTTTAFWTGEDPGDAENLYDQSAADAGVPGKGSVAKFTDGWALHSPVGSLPRFNAFGLYDVHGNVRELTLDQWLPRDGYPLRAGDGLRVPTDAVLRAGNTQSRVLRGGCYMVTEGRAVVYWRLPLAPGRRDPTVGVRVSRKVSRAE